MDKNFFSRKKIDEIDGALKNISSEKKIPFFFFYLSLGLYFIISIVVAKVSSDRSMFMFMGNRIPVSAFAGVFASMGNICLIFMVVFFGDIGFAVALTILCLQFPILLNGIVSRREFTNIPGSFSNIFAIVSNVIIYLNNKRIERFQEKMRELVITDALTGLPNHYACSELAKDYVKKGVKFAVVSIELENFKNINDTMGHDTGDKALKAIAERWNALADSSNPNQKDFVARLSGSDFFILLRDYDSSEDLLKKINRYKEELEKKITIDDCDYFMTAAFGYAEFPLDSKDANSLLAYASAAMHDIKRRGGGVLRFLPIHAKTAQTLEMERKIRGALEKDLVFFQLQPQFDLSKKLRGFEALARMKDTDGSVISPADFIPVAEKVGLVDQVDARVFRLAAKFLADLMKETGVQTTLCVNVSVRHLMKNNFLDELKEIIKASGIKPENLEIEITESIMIDSAEKALQCIKQVKEMGVKVAIDDFGTGYSSLSYLNKFPADMLKIDKSFIDVMNTSESSKQYVATIISIGHILNLKVISEGVETADQLETLQKIGCDYIQGFIWGRPLPPDEAEKLIRA